MNQYGDEYGVVFALQHLYEIGNAWSAPSVSIEDDNILLSETASIFELDDVLWLSKCCSFIIL